VYDFGRENVALLHGTVTLSALEFGVDMPGVAEKDKIGQAVNTLPWNLFAFFVKGRELLDMGTVFADGRMTGHALVSRRQSRTLCAGGARVA
jgi:hypothetical protein